MNGPQAGLNPSPRAATAAESKKGASGALLVFDITPSGVRLAHIDLETVARWLPPWTSKA
jgi:hypothetical protein